MLFQKGSAQVASLPAPIGGWNARDSIANMEALDAYELINLFPTVSNVVLRGGFNNHVTGITGQVETLMNYSYGSTQKLFGIAGTAIYDVTNSGVVGAAVVSSLTNARWEYINVATTADNYIYLVNGVDSPLLYNGTTWLAITAISAIAITGVTPTTLDNIQLFKNRVWFSQKNTLKAWYLPTSAVGGAANLLDLSSIAKKGGYIVDIGTWTLDAGYGVDDNLVFITSNGEVIVYSGTDPASSATWALIGVWNLGSPVGNRCLVKYAGDLLIITYDGLVPLAGALQSSRLDPRINLTNKIQGAITDAVNAYASKFGWQVIYFAKNNAILLNVPVSEGSAQEQYVMNTITKSWCKFQGWSANVLEIHKDDLYFGGDGVVCKAWTGYTDNVSNIQTNVLQAFNYFEQRGVKKYFTRARPSIFTNGSPAILLSMNVDFDTTNPVSSLSFSPSSQTLWNTALWDIDVWAQDTVITNTWQGITGIGYCGGIHLTSSSQGIQLEWASTDIVYQTGWAGI